MRRWLLFAMAIVWLAACGGNSPTSAVSCSQCVPSHDVAEYLDLAWQIRDTCAWGRLDACVDLLSEPRVHPPGLSAAIAMWWTLVVPGIGSAMIWAGLVNVAALSLLVAIGASLGGNLAILLRHEGGELVDVLFEQRFVFIENLHPLFDWRGRPGGERFLRGLYREVHFAVPRKRHLRNNRAGARIVHVESR